MFWNTCHNYGVLFEMSTGMTFDFNANNWFVMLCLIWCFLCNLKSMKKTKTWRSVTLSESNTPPWVFFTFLVFYKWYEIVQSVTFIIQSSLFFLLSVGFLCIHKTSARKDWLLRNTTPESILRAWPCIWWPSTSGWLWNETW